MRITNKNQTYRFSVKAIALLWSAFCAFAIASANIVFLNDWIVALTSVAFAIVFGRLALRAAVWKICFSPHLLEWTDLMTREVVLRGDVEGIAYEAKGRKAKASYHLTIYRKSGKRLLSPPLAEDDAAAITKSAQLWLLAETPSGQITN